MVSYSSKSMIEFMTSIGTPILTTCICKYLPEISPIVEPPFSLELLTNICIGTPAFSARILITDKDSESDAMHNAD